MILFLSNIDTPTVKNHTQTQLTSYQAQGAQDILYGFIYHILALRKLIKQLKILKI